MDDYETSSKGLLEIIRECPEPSGMKSKVPWLDEGREWLEYILPKLLAQRKPGYLDSCLNLWEAFGVKEQILAAFRRFLESPEGAKAWADSQFPEGCTCPDDSGSCPWCREYYTVGDWEEDRR